MVLCSQGQHRSQCRGANASASLMKSNWHCCSAIIVADEEQMDQRLHSTNSRASRVQNFSMCAGVLKADTKMLMACLVGNKLTDWLLSS
jgi:hypothetical protein